MFERAVVSVEQHAARRADVADVEREVDGHHRVVEIEASELRQGRRHRERRGALAEGIEDAATQALLIDMGCDFGQGVLIAPPMPQERFLDLLRQRISKPRAPAPVSDGAAPAGSVDKVA